MRDLFRLLHIAGAIWGYFGWWMLVRLRVLRPRETPGERVCRILGGLGTTFVKLGQGLSLRRDMLPDEYANALQALQDRVPPFSAALAMDEIERALGRPVGQLFASFEDAPLAAASIAQVHAARLADGREVIVKVRRPGIKAQVSRDMRLMRLVLRGLLLLAPRLKTYQPLELTREIEANLRKEMDFRQEARNIRRFVAAFAGSTTLYVPQVIDALYGEAVMVQERSGGRRVDAPGLQGAGPSLADALAEAYLHQFFAMGVFHGDPHPGNLFVMEDGRICFHDFGLVGFLDQSTRRSLAGFLQAFVHQDAAWLLDAYLELGILAGRLDRADFRRGLEELLQDYAGLPLKDLSLAEAFLRLARFGRGHNLRLPQNLLVLMRTLFLLESTMHTLDPDFDLVDRLSQKAEETLSVVLTGQAAAAVKARLKYEAGLSLQEMPEALGPWMRKLRTQGLELPVRHRGLDEFEQHVDRTGNRVALALVTLGLYIAASLLMQHSLGPRIGEIPLVATIGYALALWFTWRLVRGISRSGRL